MPTGRGEGEGWGLKPSCLGWDPKHGSACLHLPRRDSLGSGPVLALTVVGNKSAAWDLNAVPAPWWGLWCRCNCHQLLRSPHCSLGGHPQRSFGGVLVCCSITFYYNHCSLKQHILLSGYYNNNILYDYTQFSGLGVLNMGWLGPLPRVTTEAAIKVWDCTWALILRLYYRRHCFQTLPRSCWQISFPWDYADCLYIGWRAAHRSQCVGFSSVTAYMRHAHSVTNLKPFALLATG